MPAIDKTFDYTVPERWADRVAVGAMVRVSLAGRRVGGWIVEVDVEPPLGLTLQPLAKISGVGPPPDIIDLARWAAWRWVGRTAAFLRTASPPRMISALAPPRRAAPIGADSAVVRVPPAADVMPWIPEGNTLVLVPDHDRARSLARRLGAALYPEQWARAAAGARVVGTRAAAFAPMHAVSAVVVVDEQDEAYQEERAPTWHARDVALERAKRAGVPCVLLTPTPSLEALDALPLQTLSRAEERAGWPIVEVVDRRREDPRTAGLYSERLVGLLRSPGRVVCVLNRRGRARLLACDACGALAVCAECGGGVAELEQGTLTCRTAGHQRPVICLDCGATRFRNLRAGVSRVREELEALVRERVAEVTADTAVPDDGRVFVGTEAVLHRLDRADTVAFLEFDQELSAPRFRAAEQALVLLARAARLVGGRGGGGRLLVQTRQPRHEAVMAAVHADPGRLVAVEVEKRRALSLPPFSALARVSGAAASTFVERLGQPLGLAVAPQQDGSWLVKASDHDTIADELGAVERPTGRLRIEIDPLRV